MLRPDPLIIVWQGRQLRVRHDDPQLGPYSSKGATVRSAVELPTAMEGLRQYVTNHRGARLQSHWQAGVTHPSSL